MLRVAGGESQVVKAFEAVRYNEYYPILYRIRYYSHLISVKLEMLQVAGGESQVVKAFEAVILESPWNGRVQNPVFPSFKTFCVNQLTMPVKIVRLHHQCKHGDRRLLITVINVVGTLSHLVPVAMSYISVQ